MKSVLTLSSKSESQRGQRKHRSAWEKGQRIPTREHQARGGIALSVPGSPQRTESPDELSKGPALAVLLKLGFQRTDPGGPRGAHLAPAAPESRVQCRRQTGKRLAAQSTELVQSCKPRRPVSSSLPERRCQHESPKGPRPRPAGRSPGTIRWKGKSAPRNITGQRLDDRKSGDRPTA